MTRRYALRDDQWERIKDILPGRTEDVGATEGKKGSPQKGVKSHKDG